MKDKVCNTQWVNIGNSKIELNEQFKKALDLMETSRKNVFVTGKAGTGKSTLLDYFRRTTKKKVVVLAPTGVAALNVKGQTIHSFFNFKPDITKDKVKKIRGEKKRIFKEIDTIIIDEISMVRADLLDCVDRSLRLNRKSNKPFGGVQMIFIGDLYQLPPVVTSREKELFNNYYRGAYFFNARVFRELAMEFVELEKIYRQKDEKFINLLNAVRNNTLRDEDIAILNQQVNKKFSKDDFVITLTTTNKKAEEINCYQLKKLGSPIHTYQATIRGEFDEQSYPTDELLQLAVGAQVMLLNNDSQGRWVNGTLGEVREIVNKEENKCDTIVVELSGGEIEEVLPFKWEVFHFKYDEQTGRIDTEAVGTFTQYPLKLAWAVTIHKSQGKTFPRVVIDFSRGVFAPGQAYVALSRCVSLKGISLTRPFKKGYVFNDPEIVNFLTQYQYRLTEKETPLEKKLSYIKKAMEEDKFLQIVYLKPNGDKTRRIIKPYSLGERFYKDKPFIGVEAYCKKRNDIRIFRVDRIIQMEVVGWRIESDEDDYSTPRVE